MDFGQEFFTYLIGQRIDENGATLSFNEQDDIVFFHTDADFELKRLVMFGSLDETNQTESSRFIPNFNFNLRDNSTGRTLFNGFASTAELFGDGRIPFVLPTSHFFRRGGQAQILYDLTDPGTDFGNALVWLGLVGAKHFERGIT
jgi:hypothetical protein